MNKYSYFNFIAKITNRFVQRRSIVSRTILRVYYTKKKRKSIEKFIVIIINNTINHLAYELIHFIWFIFIAILEFCLWKVQYILNADFLKLLELKELFC